MTEAAYDLQVAENDGFAHLSNAEARREHAGRTRREAPRASRPTARMIAGTGSAALETLHEQRSHVQGALFFQSVQRLCQAPRR
jgi:hypothetical protein